MESVDRGRVAADNFFHLQPVPLLTLHVHAFFFVILNWRIVVD